MLSNGTDSLLYHKTKFNRIGLYTNKFDFMFDHLYKIRKVLLIEVIFYCNEKI